MSCISIVTRIFHSGLITDSVVNVLIGLAWEDVDNEVRHQAIAALFKLASGREGL